MDIVHALFTLKGFKRYTVISGSGYKKQESTFFKGLIM